MAIGNPAGWPGGGDFATAEHLVVDVDADKLIHGRHIVLPSIAVERPTIDAQQLADGSANFKFETARRSAKQFEPQARDRSSGSW